MQLSRESLRWLAVGLVVAGSSGCGKSAPPPSPEVAQTAGAITLTNGLWTNGLSTNGLWTNGLWTNGLWTNGLWTNGLWTNGLWTNGLWTNGLWTNGLWTNGQVQNGLWTNGLWTNGLWTNGLWTNGLAGDTLKASPYARELLQYVYACAMPGTRDPQTGAPLYGTAIIPDDTLTCSSAASCDEGYTCSGGKCVVPLVGAVGLGINADGSTWWESGTCDESCQRWVSACVLARTNAYGAHVEISMRAPADAPPGREVQFAKIQAALATSEPELTDYPLREGAYYGNIFATTPELPAPDPAYTGPTAGKILASPSFYACAGPGSNIPEITKRFCSSQGDQVVIKVPGICVTNGPVTGVCDGIDGAGSIFGCSTSKTAPSTRYDEVVTVYLKRPISVCGNAVCEEGETPANDSAGCPSDCHPGTWAKHFSQPFIQSSTDSPPDDGIVVAGAAPGDVDLGGTTLPAGAGTGVLAKIDASGDYAWGLRFGDDLLHVINPSGVLVSGVADTWRLSGVKVAANGDITLVGIAVHYGPWTHWVWGSRYTKDGVQIGSTWAVPFLSLVSDSFDDWIFDNGKFAVDALGNVVVTATYHSPTKWRAFVAKISPEGRLLWTTPMDLPPQFDGGLNPLSLVMDSHANVVVLISGAVYDSAMVRFCAEGPAAVSGSTTCADGSASWTQSIGQPFCPPTRFNDIAIDSDRNVYATGTVGYGQSLGGGTVTAFEALNGPPTIAKYGPDGSYKWASWGTVLCSGMQAGYCLPAGACNSVSEHMIGGSGIGFDPTGDVVMASFGNAAVGGGIDFGVGAFPTYSSPNIYLSAYDPAGGSLRWAKKIPTILTSSLGSVALDRNRRVVVTGAFSGSMQIDDRLLVTSIPERSDVVHSFIGSFTAPSPLDKTPPTIGLSTDQTGAQVATLPLHIVAQATSAAGAVVFYMPPTAVDSGNAGTSVSCVPPPNTTFPVGTTAVTCTASDPLGNRATATFPVTVMDLFAPVLSAVTDLAPVDATSASGAVVTYDAPTAADQVDGAVAVSCVPASGSVFAAGTTTVTCTARDKANNQAQTTFKVTVTPQAAPPPPPPPPPPTFGGACTSDTDCAAGRCVDGVCCNTTAPSCGQCGACNLPGSAGTCAPTSGDACDDGNACTMGDTCVAGTCAGTVPPPALSAGIDQTVVGTCSSAPVAYAQPQVAGASCQTGVTIGCTPVPGNRYGANTVTCTATNAAGAVSAPVSFKVTVLRPLTMRIQPPLTGDNGAVDNVVKAGSTVPVKVLLFACGADVTATAAVDAKLAVNYKAGGGSNTTTTVTATSSGAGDTNGVMVFDGRHYRYNLSTKGYSATRGVPAFYQVNLSASYKSSPGVVIGTDSVQLDVK